MKNEGNHSKPGDPGWPTLPTWVSINPKTGETIAVSKERHPMTEAQVEIILEDMAEYLGLTLKKY